MTLLHKCSDDGGRNDVKARLLQSVEGDEDITKVGGEIGFGLLGEDPLLRSVLIRLDLYANASRCVRVRRQYVNTARVPQRYRGDIAAP